MPSIVSWRPKKPGSLLRNSATYAFGDMLEKAIGLAMLPAYVYFLTPADFGVIALVGAVTGLGGSVLSLGIYQSVTRYYYNPPRASDGPGVVGTAWLLLMLVPAFCVSVLVLFGEPVFRFLFEGPAVLVYGALTILITYCNVAFIEMALAATRTKALARKYVTVVLLRASLTALLSLALLITVDSVTALEVVIAQAVATLLCALYSAYLLIPHARLSRKLAGAAPILRFGLPLMPLSASQWALRMQDRLLLNKFASVDQVGVYAVAQRLASPMQILMGAGLRALLPILSKAANGEGGDEVRSAVVRIFGAGTLICLFGSLLAPVISRSLLPSAYHSAAGLTMVLIPGLFAAAVFHLASNAIAFYAGRTYRVTALTMVAVGANAALNVVLIPWHGVLGASLAALVTYTGLAVVAWILSPLPELLADVQPWLLLAALSTGGLLAWGAWLNSLSSSGRVDGFQLALGFVGALILQALLVVFTIIRTGTR